MHFLYFFSSFFFNDPSPTEIYTLSLHDALPICHRTHARNAHSAVGSHQRPLQIRGSFDQGANGLRAGKNQPVKLRSEEHTSELQSHSDLVCRLLLEKKKKKNKNKTRL